MTTAVESLGVKNVKYAGEIIANLNKGVAELHENSASMHQAKMRADEDEIEKLWLKSVTIQATLKEDLDIANVRLNEATPHLAKPYVTPWDCVLRPKPSSV